LGAFIEGQSPPCAETFVNDARQVASDLHIVFFPGAQPISVGLVQNAPGCPSPAYSFGSNVVDVDWGIACVDPGESATFVFIPFDSAQAPPRVESFSWTFGTPGSTPTPIAPTEHDGRVKKISAAASVVLSDGFADVKSIGVRVRNEGDHVESFGVYADIVPPGGTTNPHDCRPQGRIIDTIITCTEVAGALGQTYTITAAVDAHADDAGGCPVFEIQSMTCFVGLADDDDDDADDRTTTNAFRVK
jgi:hypothetical protein